MGLEKRRESNTIYLQVKHFCLWQEVKQPTGSSESVEVTNPKTGQVITKHGYKYGSLTARAEKLLKYDTGDQYAARYFGFKLHMRDGDQAFVIDMPYQSQMLRRFLRTAHNIDWNLPLTITVFKGKTQDKTEDSTGIWFTQRGETVKPYYTRENPHGMPNATQDPDTHEWDFKAQHRWLIERLKEETIPDIEEAAKRHAPPVEPEHHGEEPHPETTMPPYGEISDDDVPF